MASGWYRSLRCLVRIAVIPRVNLGVLLGGLAIASGFRLNEEAVSSATVQHRAKQEGV